MSTTLLLPTTRPPSSHATILRWSLAFWLFSYILLSAIAALIPTAPGLLNDTRLIATGVGAICFAFVLHWTHQTADRLDAGRIAAILATILPASLFVLAARLVTDMLQYGEVRDLNRDLRWAMIWAGYFGLWVSAALALQWERCRARSAAAPGAREQVLDQAVATTHAASVPVTDWDDVIGVLADEMSQMTQGDRRVLAERLAQRAGYEMIDEWSDVATIRRRALLRRLAARLDRP